MNGIVNAKWKLLQQLIGIDGNNNKNGNNY